MGSVFDGKDPNLGFKEEIEKRWKDYRRRKNEFEKRVAKVSARYQSTPKPKC